MVLFRVLLVLELRYSIWLDGVFTMYAIVQYSTVQYGTVLCIET